MRKSHENTIPIEHTELIHSAKRCVQILCFVEINASFPNVKTNIRAHSSLKESAIFLTYFKDFIAEEKFNISRKEQLFILSFLDTHITIANKILKEYNSSKEIIEQVAISFPFEKEKKMGSIIFYILKKWLFNENTVENNVEIIAEKLAWANVLRKTLETILYKNQTDICLHNDDIHLMFNLINLHCNNLKKLLMTDEERLKEMEVAKNFAKKVASSSAVITKKKKVEEII